MAELDKAAIAARIQEAREQAGLKQPELGDALTPPVHYRTIQTWESLKEETTPWDRLDEIAQITGTTKVWLLHGEDASVPADLVGRLEAVADGLAETARQLTAILEAQALPPEQEAEPRR